MSAGEVKAQSQADTDDKVQKNQDESSLGESNSIKDGYGDHAEEYEDTSASNTVSMDSGSEDNTSSEGNEDAA